jgi:hypothetical protein
LPSDGRDKKGEAMIRDLPRKAGKKGEVAMATNPNVPPPEPVPPLNTPPEPGEVQTTPMPME